MYFEDLKKGTRVKLDKINIKKEDMLEFAHKFDTLKIHTDEAYAKNTIFKDLIAPGVFSFMSMWVNFLKYDFIGDEMLVGLSTYIEWVSPVYAGDTLTGEAYIHDLIERNEKNGIAVIRVDVYNQKGILVLKDETKWVVKKRI